jgi:SRSO17 transposase
MPESASIAHRDTRTRPAASKPSPSTTAPRTVREGLPQHGDGVRPECWLLVQWPPGQNEPTDYWLSDLPPDTSLSNLVRLAKSRWRIEHDYRELRTGLGLDHFEGRSWIGWHRHVTLATAAQLFLTQLRLTDPKQGSPEPRRRPATTAGSTRHLARLLPTLPPTSTDPSTYNQSLSAVRAQGADHTVAGGRPGSG